MLGFAPFEALPQDTAGATKVVEEANKILAIAG